MTLALATVLLSGCESKIVDDHCLIYEPVTFEKPETLEYLLEHEREFLEQIVVQNETWEISCL